MKYKVICEVSFPTFELILDVTIPYNKTIVYVCKILDELIIEKICPSYQPKESSVLVDKKTGEVYDKNKLVNETNIKNGSKLMYY